VENLNLITLPTLVQRLEDLKKRLEIIEEILKRGGSE